jgi:hypothetical protein
MRIPLRRGLAIAVAAASTLTALTVLTVGAGSASADVPTDFYQLPAPLPAGSPGDIVKSATTTYTSTSGVTSTVVMYLSQNAHNQPMAVTGTILVPSTPWTGSGSRPIVAYAPFTMGLGAQCAPSKTMSGGGSQDIVSGVQTGFINALLQKGFAVAQTDYEGEGTTGGAGATYVLRSPIGHAVLDVLRAALKLPSSGLSSSAPMGIAGYSEGGSGSAAAAELAPTYAPELHIVAAYAGAVPADLATLSKSLDGGLYAAFLGDAVIGINNAYPEANMLSLVNSTGAQDLVTLSNECTLNSIFSFAFTNTSTLTKDGRPVAAYLNQAPFNTIVAENTLGNVAPSFPTLVESAQNDDVIPNATVVAMAKSWCAKGAKVDYQNIPSFLPFFTHALAGYTAEGDAANYLAAEFAGQGPASNCGQF